MFVWLAIGVSGIMFISVSRLRTVWLSTLLKFASVSLLLFILLVQLGSSDMVEYSEWIALGLLCALLADVLFMLSPNQYSAGIGLFVIASLSYSKAFWLQVPGQLSLWLPSMLYAAIVIVFFIGLPRLAEIVLPVIILGCCQVQMTWAALEVWMQTGTVQALYGCLGASLFLLSCVMWAFKHKERPKRNGNPFLDTCYFISQALITVSVTGSSTL